MVPGLPPSQVRMLAVPWFVGQFVMSWSKHERMLIHMLSRISQRDFEALRNELLDSQITAYEFKIREAISVIGDQHLSIPYLAKVLEEHVRLRALRNEIVHGHWSGIGEDNEILLKRKPRRAAQTVRTFELQELISGWQRLDALGVVMFNAGQAFEGKEPI
jgi:hypothetical protein